MPNKLLQLCYLMRLDKPIGALLLFFPCSFGLLINLTQHSDLSYLILFLIGSFVMRAAGCIINDLFDQKLDRKVARTKNRPLAAKQISLNEAIILLICLLIIGLCILLQLPFQAIMVGFVVIIPVILYPLAKRYTYWPQLVLGFIFNIGVIISGLTIGNLNWQLILLYLGCIAWTLGYDTIYAFMDIEDDLKIGVKSSAIYIQNKKPKIWLYGFYGFFICSFILAAQPANNFITILAFITAIAILFWQIYFINFRDIAGLLRRFISNQYVGLALMLVLLLNNIIISNQANLWVLAIVKTIT